MPKKTTTRTQVTPNNKILANLVALKMTSKHPEMVGWMVKLVEAFPTLRHIRVEFSGGGDSGDINDYFLEDSDHADIKFATNFPVAPDRDDFLHSFINTHVPCDWVNNDGGGGQLSFDLETGEVEVDSHYYETVETECEAVTVKLLD
jgi:hypothetical protein